MFYHIYSHILIYRKQIMSTEMVIDNPFSPGRTVDMNALLTIQILIFCLVNQCTMWALHILVAVYTAR